MDLQTKVQRWHELKLEENRAKENRQDIEAEIWLELKEDLKDEGSTSFNLDGFKLTIKQDYTVKVDQEKAAITPHFFKTKYELSYSQFKKIDNKNLVEEIVTITPAKPNFTVEIK